MSRSMSLRKTCTEPGCKEFGLYTDLTREAYNRLARQPWACVRHTRPDENLSLTNRKRETVYENRQIDGLGLFWNGSSGFMHGPGFKAFAEDFPAGAKIRVTAEVISDDQV